jgi:hypothetical protein
MHNRKIKVTLITAITFTISIIFQTFALASDAYSGSGDQIVDLKLTNKTLILKLTHQGSSNFAVWAKDKNAENIDLLVNEVGNYSGTTLVYPNRKTLKYLEVTADGSWSAEVVPLSSARKWSKKLIEGTGDDVIQLSKTLPSSTKIKFNFVGNGNFAVWTFDKNGKRLDLKANEVGNYSGTKFLGKSVKYIEIIAAEGTWSLQR